LTCQHLLIISDYSGISVQSLIKIKKMNGYSL